MVKKALSPSPKLILNLASLNNEILDKKGESNWEKQ
jgi:hypothetical protein